MDAITVINEYKKTKKELPSILVSGTDKTIKEVILRQQIDYILQMKKHHIVIDFTEENTNYQLLSNMGVHTVAMIPGKKRYLKIFSGNDVETLYRLRQLFSVAEYNEEKQQKVIAYLYFLQHIDNISGNVSVLSIELIKKYSSTIRFTSVLDELVIQGRISEIERQELLGKYIELSEAGPELENLIMTVAGVLMISADDSVDLSKTQGGESIYFNLGRIKDKMFRKVILLNLKWDIEEYYEKTQEKIAITIFAKGRQEDTVVVPFWEEVEAKAECIFLTDNVFSVGQDMEQIKCTFPVTFYGRHENMGTCKKIEELFGNVFVARQTYSYSKNDSVHRSIIDRILGTDITRTYTTLEPKEEPRYRKEDIFIFPAGYGIMCYEGQSSLIRL